MLRTLIIAAAALALAPAAMAQDRLSDARVIRTAQCFGYAAAGLPAEEVAKAEAYLKAQLRSRSAAVREAARSEQDKAALALRRAGDTEVGQAVIAQRTQKACDGLEIVAVIAEAKEAAGKAS